MGPQEFETKTIKVLKGHLMELDRMETVITAAAKSRVNIPNLREILKQLSDTASECRETLDFYEAKHLPDSVRIALADVQQAVSVCCSALVLHYTKTMPG